VESLVYLPSKYPYKYICIIKIVENSYLQTVKYALWTNISKTTKNLKFNLIFIDIENLILF